MQLGHSFRCGESQQNECQPSEVSEGGLTQGSKRRKQQITKYDVKPWRKPGLQGKNQDARLPITPHVITKVKDNQGKNRNPFTVPTSKPKSRGCQRNSGINGTKILEIENLRALHQLLLRDPRNQHKKERGSVNETSDSEECPIDRPLKPRVLHTGPKTEAPQTCQRNTLHMYRPKPNMLLLRLEKVIQSRIDRKTMLTLLKNDYLAL